MLCRKFKVTMSTNACIRRQEWAITLKTKLILESTIKSNDHSLITCLTCTQGKAVKKNPNKFINRDFLILKEKHLQLIRKRGWVFKDPISYDSLFDTFDYAKIKSKRRNDNDRSKIYTKSAAERITRFVRKHRSPTGSKSHILPSIRIKFEVRKKFRNYIRNNRR